MAELQIKYSTLAALILLSSSLMANDNPVEQAKQYVSQLDNSCSYQAGYRCETVEENTFMTAEGLAQTFPAMYLEAATIALNDFKQLKQLSAEQKKMKHYKIGLTEDKDHYIVYFHALLLPQLDKDGKPVGILRTSLGQSTKYWLSKKDMTIQKRLFMK